MEVLRDMEEDDIRIEALGRDCHGNSFYYFPQFFEVWCKLLITVARDPNPFLEGSTYLSTRTKLMESMGSWARLVSEYAFYTEINTK